MSQDTTIATGRSLLGSGTGTQLFLGLLWLGITVWTTHATITGGGEGPSGVLGDAAQALPGIVSTTVVTGASIASAAASRFGNALVRLMAGLVAGAVFGAAVAGGLRLAYGPEPAIAMLAVTVALASVAGGAAAALPNAVLEAGLWAVSWVFFAFLILGVLQTQAVALLGDETRFVYAAAAAAGLLGGLHGYRHLRTEGAALPWFLVSGALPGLILLGGEALTRMSGTAEELSSAARVQDGLIVLAVGALVCLLGGASAAQRSKVD